MTVIIVRRPDGALRPFKPFYRPISLFDEIEGFLRRPVGFGIRFAPRTEMYEEKGELVIKSELSDVKEKDLDIKLEGDVLTIKAEKKREEVDEDTKHGERYFGRYYRSLRLPFHVDADKVSATFENGLLEIRIPRMEEVKTKQIEVKARLPEGKEKKRPRKRKQTAS